MIGRPKVVISRCIEHDSCRWNGLIISNPLVKHLKDFIDFIPVCAEVEIGLGIPRDPIRIVEREESISLENSVNTDNHTAKMNCFSDRYLQTLPSVHGFILKSRSPSCGTNNVKIYSLKGNVLSSKGVGLFAKKVFDYYPGLAIEDENRLLNLRIREHFLTKLYTLFRLANTEKTMNELIKYHSNNKYLFMAYNQEKQKEAGVIIANRHKSSIDEVYKDYSLKVMEIIYNMPRNSGNINVLQHLFGYFSKKYLNKEEKILFYDLIERYRNFQIPLVTLTSVIQLWIAKYDNTYLKNQTYLQPFPKGLQTIFDTGKGRIGQSLQK